MERSQRTPVKRNDILSRASRVTLEFIHMFVYSVQSISPRAVLPLSIERDMAKLVTSNNSSDDCGGTSLGGRRKAFAGRRAKSLDSVVVADSEPTTPRCPSPTPSSGVDSNKDSPIQIENIDGSSIGMLMLNINNS